MITTKNELCEVGISLFQQHGYEKTSVAKICAALNVTRGSFYYHFQSKADLLLYWFSQAANDRIRFNFELSTPKEILKNFINDYIGLITSIGQDLMYAIILAELEVEGKQYNIFQSDRVTYGKLVDEAKKIGEITSDIPTNQLIDTFAAAFLGTIMIMHFQPSEVDIMTRIEQVFETIYN